jgi:hypothetical protein
MILDNTNIFSDGQAITATANSTNVIDIGAAGTPQGASVAIARDIPFPAEIPEGTAGRYTRLNYTVTGTAPSTGKIFAGVVAARQSNP